MRVEPYRKESGHTRGLLETVREVKQRLCVVTSRVSFDATLHFVTYALTYTT